MDDKDAPLWNENPFTLPNSNPSYLHPLNIRCTTFGLAIFISNDFIAFRDSNKVQLFSIPQNKIIHELRHGENIRSFFPVNNEIIISFGYYNMYIWELSTGRRVCKIKFNERSIPVHGDEGYTFTLCRHSAIDAIRMESNPHSNRISSRLLWSKRYKSAPNNFISVRWATRFGNKILISKDDGLILFHVSNQKRKFKVINRLKFLVDERLYYKDLTTMNDRYFVHPDGEEIIVRDIETFQVLRRSTDFADIPFHDNDMGRTFSARLSNISLYQSMILLHFYSAEKGEANEMQCYHAFIVSSIKTGNIIFKYAFFTTKDTTLQKPQLDRRGIIINDGRVKIVTLPDSVFEDESLMYDKQVELRPMKDIYLSLLLDPKRNSNNAINKIRRSDLGRRSIEEFYWSHRIIMLNASDWTSDMATSNGEKRTELEDLYYDDDNIQLTSGEDGLILERALQEAEIGGVISKRDVERNLKKLTVDNRRIPKLHQMGKELIQDFKKSTNHEVTKTEKFSCLKTALQRYSNNLKMFELVCLGFNLIPFLAPSDEHVTELVETVFEELHIEEDEEELVTYLDNGCYRSTNNLEIRVLKYVAGFVRRNNTDFPDYHDRENLISFLKDYGTSPETLKMVFIHGTKSKFIQVFEEMESNVREEHNHIEMSTSPNIGTKLDENICERLDIRDDESISSFRTIREDVRLERNRFAASFNTVPGELNMDGWTIQELFDFDGSTELMRTLNTQNCSMLLTAHIVRYAEDQQKKFDRWKGVVFRALSFYGVDGFILSDREKLDNRNLPKLLVDYIEKEYPDCSLDVDLDGKIRSFSALF